MQHIEFFHKNHFDNFYHRKKAKKSLLRFIDYFWETDFNSLWHLYPKGFSDALFPNIGYTYLLNLGTPFIMQLEEERHLVKSDAFLPRCKNMICHHSKGNKIFGIKFKVSPVVFEKKINFYEYREYLFPLSYLIDRDIVEKIKGQNSFDKRVEIVSAYYDKIIEKNTGSLQHVTIITEALEAYEQSKFHLTIEEIAAQNNISTRTLQRYFEATTSITGKQAFQLMRIRKAVEQLAASPGDFNYSDFGYYDYSHFYKHLKQFLNSHSIEINQPHLQLVKEI